MLCDMQCKGGVRWWVLRALNETNVFEREDAKCGRRKDADTATSYLLPGGRELAVQAGCDVILGGERLLKARRHGCVAAAAAAAAAALQRVARGVLGLCWGAVAGAGSATVRSKNRDAADSMDDGRQAFAGMV